MDFYVYILRCNDGLLYTGITNDLNKRVNDHSRGIGGPITKNRRPIRLTYTERFPTRVGAAKREKEIKGWRRQKKEQLIKNTKFTSNVVRWGMV